MNARWALAVVAFVMLVFLGWRLCFPVQEDRARALGAITRDEPAEPALGVAQTEDSARIELHLDPETQPRQEFTTTQPVQPSTKEDASAEPWNQFLPRIPVPKETFEAKYAGLGLQDLERIRDQLQDRWFLLKESALDERMAKGQFERRALTVGKGQEPGSEPPGYTLNAMKGGPEIRLSSHAEEQGVARITWLPFEEYPDLYDLQDESVWVARRCYKLGAKQ